MLSQVTLPASSVACSENISNRIDIFCFDYFFNLEVETKTFNDGLELPDVEDPIFISVKQLSAMNG